MAPMNVLGIHDGHDAGVCLIVDGRLVAFSSEERRTNRKNFMGIPTLSIAAVLKKAGMRPDDINLVAVSGTIRTARLGLEADHTRSAIHMLSFLGQSKLGTLIGRKLLSKMRRNDSLIAGLAEVGLVDRPMRFYDHHLCHAATAFYNRPWIDSKDGRTAADALVLTLDGSGDGLCATVSVGRGNSLELLSTTPKYHSIPAFMYSGTTAWLGMKAYEHEYKLMGMAPYGRFDRTLGIYQKLFRNHDLSFTNCSGASLHRIGDLYSKLFKNMRFDEVAAGCQKHFEDLMISWVNKSVAATGVTKVVAAGGAFLNVKANKLIRESASVEEMFVFPVADDGGMPLGAAILGYKDLCAEKQAAFAFAPLTSMHIGQEHTSKEIEAALKQAGAKYRPMQNEASDLAPLIAQGKIVARFQEQEEAGPRSLGNRSILADPRDLRVIRKLNFAIKQRDFWMPFAGSVLEEYGSKYIRDLTKRAWFMIEAFDTTEEGAQCLPAALHPFDQTIRPQIVSKSTHRTYHALISEFARITGVGGLLNTSFNLHGSPIVGSPETAVKTFMSSSLDALSIGSFMAFKD